jgi:hypothetical protein
MRPSRLDRKRYRKPDYDYHRFVKKWGILLPHFRLNGIILKESGYRYRITSELNILSLKPVKDTCSQVRSKGELVIYGRYNSNNSGSRAGQTDEI